MQHSNKLWMGAFLAVISLAAVNANAATVVVSSDITSSTTWSGTNTYRLTDPIFVRNGATLTIEAGAIIRGEQASSTNDAPGALVISRGAKIRAMGLSYRPIVMTDLNDDHYVGYSPSAGTAPYSTANNGITRQWGGLIVLGQTYIATDVAEPGTNSPDASLELQIEGLEPYGTYSKYGGGNDDDDSGEIHYVSIRYGGFVLGDANEINGLTMGAVGRETEIDNVEVFQNKDDGYEFFGGTVNTKYLVAWAVGDDSFDWDEGFRGKGQFWFCLQGVLSSEGDKSDKVGELDGADGDDSLPSSCPTVYNATAIGHSSYGGLKNTALHFRDGTAGRWYNGMFLDFGGACALIEGDVTDGNYDAADNTQNQYVQDAYYKHQTQFSMMLEIKNSMFWKFGYPNAIGLASGSNQGSTYGSSSKDTNKPHYGLATGYDLFAAQTGNVYLDSTNNPTPPINQLVRSAVPVDIDGNDYYPVIYVDPRIRDIRYFNCTCIPPYDGFFTPVKFQGAFHEYNWAMWTVASRQGMMPQVWGTYETTGAPVLSINEDGAGKITISLDAGTSRGYPAEFWVAWWDPTLSNYHYMNIDTGVWSFNSGDQKAMPMWDFSGIEILDATTMPAGAVVHFLIDYVPDGSPTAWPAQAGYVTHNTVL